MFENWDLGTQMEKTQSWYYGKESKIKAEFSVKTERIKTILHNKKIIWTRGRHKKIFGRNPEPTGTHFLGFDLEPIGTHFSGFDSGPGTHWNP